MNADIKKKLWFCLKIYFVIFSTSGFTMFICEEVMQTAMFGSFAYTNADDYVGLRDHIVLYMKPAAKTSSLLIHTIGLANPIMLPAYLEYLKVNEGYIKAQENLVKKKLS